MNEHVVQSPVNRRGETFADFFTIATHPAVRIGFLDAQNERPFDHDRIADRILQETPPNALKRLGWTAEGLFTRHAIELAQYRYEEGRLLFLDVGLRCKAWGHPDFPPASVRKYCMDRAIAAGGAAAGDDAELAAMAARGSVVASLRPETPPLLGRMLGRAA